MRGVTKSIDACSAGVGDLAVGLWIAEGARNQGEEVLFVSGGYDPVIKAFGHDTVVSPTGDCMTLGGASQVYCEELNTSAVDESSRAIRWQRTLGWNFVPCRPTLTDLDEAAIEWATGMVQDQRVIVIAPRAAHGSRSLPIQKWIRIAWSFQSEGVRSIAIDGLKEVVEPFPIYAYGYDWHHILALLSMAAVVVGNDSGIPHLSSTIGQPTVVAIGPTKKHIIFGHCLDVVRSVGRPDVECFGCHFKFENGYRVACDHGCEALSMIGWKSLKAEIDDVLAAENHTKAGALP